MMTSAVISCKSTMQLKEIKLLQKQRTLTLSFDDQQAFVLPCAYLRSHSPSAEMRYKEQVIDTEVNIIAIEPIGQYAVKLIFDDGHDTGIYSFEYLYQLAKKHSPT